MSNYQEYLSLIFIEFLMDSSSSLRLPPVPEEGDDLLKSIDCNFQMMNSMESPNILDVTNQVPTIQNSNSIIQLNSHHQQHYTAKILAQNINVGRQTQQQQQQQSQPMNIGFDPYNGNNQNNQMTENMGQMSPPSNVLGKLSYPKGRHRSNIRQLG